MPDKAGMRRVLLILAGGAMLLPVIARRATAQAACAVGAVAVVRTNAIFASISRFGERNSTLDVVLNAYRVDVSRLEGIVDSATRAYQEKSALLSAAARQAELGKLDAQKAQTQQRIAVLQQQVTLQRAGLLQPIENGVQAVLDSVRGEMRCAIVFDASSRAGIASVNKSLDLTDRVIERIRATGDTAIFGPSTAAATGRP